MARSRQSRPRLRAAVVPLPASSANRIAQRLGRLLPSGRSLLVGFALVAIAVGAYWGARSTDVFAIQEIEVRGAAPDAAARVRTVLRPIRATSLLTLEPDQVVDPVAALPQIAGVSYDRAFPHTLVVTVRIEQPAVVVRSGRESWLVSLRGRVLRPLDRGERGDLPRVWVSPGAGLGVGGYVGDPAAERAIRAAAALRDVPLPVAVRAVRGDRGELTLRLATGLELRLGSDTDLRLKLAVAGRIVGAVAPEWEGGPAYLDVSVPERPVAGATLNSEVEIES